MEDFNKVVEGALEESNIPYAAYALTNSETMLASGSVGFTDLEKKINSRPKLTLLILNLNMVKRL